jgi:hypothetical protein
LFGSYVISAETDTGIDTTADEPEDVPYFAMRYQLTLSAEVLRGWAESMDQARHLAAECIQSDTFRDLVINGISPDGTVDWPAAGIES